MHMFISYSSGTAALFLLLETLRPGMILLALVRSGAILLHGEINLDSAFVHFFLEKTSLKALGPCTSES